MGVIDFLFANVSWVANGLGAAGFLLMGNRYWWAPLVNLFAQVFWFLLAWKLGDSGLWFGGLFWTAVHGRNAVKWWKERPLPNVG